MKVATLLLAFIGIVLGQATRTLAVVSAADYEAFPLAPGSIVSLFGSNIAPGIYVAANPPPAPLPTTLGGVNATITDASGNALAIPLIVVTPSQVNAVLPSRLQPGTAIVHLNTASKDQLSSAVTLADAAPSIFTADESGGWLAAAQAVITHPDGTQTLVGSVAKCASNLVWNGSTWSGCVPIPINLGSSSDQAVLELFGTGIRGANDLARQHPSYAAVEVYAGKPCNEAFCNTNYLEVLYAGPQGGGETNSFYGLDQVNVLLPHSMTGSGLVALTVTALVGFTSVGQGVGANSNTVMVDIQ